MDGNRNSPGNTPLEDIFQRSNKVPPSPTPAPIRPAPMPPPGEATTRSHISLSVWLLLIAVFAACAIGVVLSPLVRPELQAQSKSQSQEVIQKAPEIIVTATRAPAAPASGLHQYGPVSGRIPHSQQNLDQPLYFEAGIYPGSFNVGVRFYNPYDAAIHPWDVAITFRGSNNGAYELLLDSSRQKSLYYFDTDEFQGSNNPPSNNQTGLIAFHVIPNVDVSGNGSNLLELNANGASLNVSVNGQSFGPFDISKITNPGRIRLWAGLVRSNQISNFMPGAVTKFEDFTVDPLDASYGQTPDSASVSQAPRWRVRLYNMDDRGAAELNGTPVTTLTGTSYEVMSKGKWVDITGQMRSGDNTLSLSVWNNEGGYTWGFSVECNGSVVWDDHAGEVGTWGVNNDDRSRPNQTVYQRTLTLQPNGTVSGK